MRIISRIILFLSIFGYAAKASFDPEWVIEDAFEKELLSVNDIQSVTPAELKNSLEKYNKGQYRVAIDILQKIRELNLPDNRQDFIIFALGECYRQIDVEKKAIEQYEFIIKNFSLSDKVGASYYRILEYAVKNNEVEKADSISYVFQTEFRKHSLFNSALYLTAKSYYEQKRYGESIQLLSQIAKNSSLYYRACFLSAMSYIHIEEHYKAIALLEDVRKNSSDLDLSAEAAILIGDIYYNKNNLINALTFYNAVPFPAKRYHYALLKIARANVDLNRLEDAERLALKFMRRYPNNDYYFEMASILEQVYTKSGKEKQAEQVDNLIHSQIIDNRLLFEVYEEIDRIKDIIKGWQILEYTAIRKQNKNLISLANENIDKAKDLDARFRELLNQMSSEKTAEKQDFNNQIPHLAERRYLNVLKKRNAALEDSIENLSKELQLLKDMKENSKEKKLKSSADSITNVISDMNNERILNENEYALIIKKCLGGDEVKNQIDGEIQARFVDWSFMSYQRKKNLLKQLSEKIAERNRMRNSGIKLNKKDTMAVSIDSAEIERKKIVESIADDRDRLKEHMRTMLEVYPKNRYNPQMCFRLAELYFDAAGEEFQKKLHDYEMRITTGKDTTGIQFPEYNLDKVISMYDRIQKLHPEDLIADDACFYKALALQKVGMDSAANDVFLNLIKNYPESEYYVEANMGIGRFYFDHPKDENGQGYKLAEDAYRKVLYYKDHPQYVQALYHLGWCYYMQDKFDDAISVFKYLVQEGNLDFDPSRSEDKQVTNPLLRGEAIDYIAISFDEDRRVDDAGKFLQLIGNQDYSAIIFKRIGELREEDLDYANAISVYRKLLDQYPLSSVAPDAMVRLIKIYESQNKSDSALIVRKEFYQIYSKSSSWQKRNLELDSVLVKRVDSMAISIGLYTADDYYRNAEKNGNNEDYQQAAKCYQLIIDKYNTNVKSADAWWNLAVILQSKMGKREQAFNNFIEFSRNTIYDLSRREQAALNALSIAQTLLPSDTAVKKGQLDLAAKKVILASDNYCRLFPEGNSFSQVIIGMGAVYFNRKMFNEALERYGKINSAGSSDPNYYESLLYTGQCYYGLEKYASAAEIFEKIWKECNDQGKRTEAIKLLLQSEFLNAKQLFNSGEYQKAAFAFRSIEDKYPGSTYGDIVLYNAAEAFEKMDMWNNACINYYDLANRYPESRLAADALFNAAGDYEKGDKFLKAAETYEFLVSKYPESEKAKDAMFNLGFCYEKLGKLDKMAEVNEQYSLKYPGEKDVEALLLRSAEFYHKTGQFDKAVTVYRNFVLRFPKSLRSVEALYMVGKCYKDQNDHINALLSYEQVELHNNKLIKEGFEGNNFYASEAAYQIASLKRDQFIIIKLILPEDQIKAAIKNKSDLLQEAVKAYQRVMQYRSEKMFEAAYRVGELYQNFSEACLRQERPKLDLIKSAVLEKDIYNLSSQLMQKALLPYRKAIELADGFDSLNPDQRSWIRKSGNSLIYCYVTAGEQSAKAIETIKNAPVPEEIKEKPLHHYQYLKQLYETLAPMKEDLIKYYSRIIDQIDTMNLNDSIGVKFKNEFARIYYLLGNDYDQLSVEILKSTQNLPKNLSEDEREELLFQLEDIVFELQDKAILSYEDAIGRLQERGFLSNIWYGKIWESLARLSPDKYGKSFFQSITIANGEDWLVRADSVARWNTKDAPHDGWGFAKQTKSDAISIADEKVSTIWGEEKWDKLYGWKHVFLAGAPSNASIYVSSPAKFKVYINGVLTMNDTSGARNGDVDSATGIVALVNGGDNVLSFEVERNDDIKSGIAILFSALIDTTKKFDSSIKLPSVAREKSEKVTLSADTTQKGHSTNRDVSFQYRSKKGIHKAIEEYLVREKIANEEIKKERVKIQKILLKIEAIDAKLKDFQHKKSSEKK